MPNRKVEPKFVMLKRLLLERIQAGKVGEQLPSIREMEQMYSVTRPTIDRVMQELRMARWIDVRHGRGIFIAEAARKNYTALVFGSEVLHPATSPFYRLLLMHLQEQTRSLGIPTHYFLEVPDYKNPENPNFHHLALIEGLERGNISSVLFGQVVDPAFMLSIRNRGIPTVYFGQMTGDYGSVFLDFPGMIFEGLKAFRQMGCRRVGLITAIFERNLSGVEPADGYNRDYFERVHQLGLDTDPRLVCDSQGVDIREILEKSFYQRGADYVDSILKEFGREDYPDGLLITDDVLASGVLDRLNVVWPRWREELKVMTHSNEGSPIISHYNPYIIRLEIEIGKIASRMISLLQGIKSGNERPEPELLLPHVIGL